MLLLTISLFQIVGRGNDQVAMTSKFETREDFGMLCVNFVCSHIIVCKRQIYLIHL